uniref:Odorant receptor n=1 Tax=Cydia pomonella TaxID=82600 RepID=A0A0V0J0Y6_CYDPO
MDVRFDNTFKLTSAALYLNLAHPFLTRNLQWAIRIFIFYVFYTPSFIFLIYSSFYDTFTKICTNLSISVLYCINLFNYGLLIIYKKPFMDMIKIVEENLRNSRELIDEDEKTVKEFTAKGIKAAKFWTFCCVLVGVMFSSKAVIGTSYSAFTGNFKPVAIHELTYPAYIEERKNGFLMYIVIFGFHTFYIVFTILMDAGFSPLGPIFILHACGQIQVAIQQVERLFLDNDIDVDDILNKLKNITRRLQNIYSFVDQIQYTHRLLYEMCLKASTIFVAISLFAIIESYKEGSLNFDLLCYSFSALLLCGIPCYYCEALLGKGAELRVAIYECGWERFWVPKSRSIILVLLTRTVRPLGIKTVFCTLSLEAFGDVINQVYTIFNVMNAAYN